MDDDQELELEALEGIMNDPSAKPIKLSYGLLKYITDNFSKKIGHGGFGGVYQGCWQNGVVAVKKFFNTLELSDQLFMDEINCLKSTNHRNIVRFLGYCADTQEEMVLFNGTYVLAGERNRLLCFEYIPNGNIQQYLEETPDGNEWYIRYKIIKGVCQGLHYLHEKRISHLDLKPENVMLDDAMEPKIMDFGLSRFLDNGKSIIFTKNFRGTCGYIAPEFITKGQISFKSDIYALGIVIIKLLTGRNNIDFDNWHESLDVERPRVTSCIGIARSCIEADQDHRPTISEIIHELDAMESMIQELTDDTKEQAGPMAFAGTEMLDVHPLELSFRFKPNKQQQEMHCQLSLINKTHGEAGFFVLPPNLGIFKSNNGILMPTSTSIFTLTMLTSQEYDQPPLALGSSNEVSIFMFTMRSNDNVREMMKTSVDKDGEVNMSTDDLCKKVQKLGGEIHQARVTVIVVDFSEHNTAPPFVENSFVYEGSYDTVSTDVHPTKPWILVSSNDVCIWNWQTDKKMHIGKYSNAYSTKFIARKQWFLFRVRINPSRYNIYVYTCPTLYQSKRVVKLKERDPFNIEVHPTRPLLLLYSEYKNRPMKLLDWNQNWFCTRTFDIVKAEEEHTSRMVVQAMFNPMDASNFATLSDDKKIQIWNLDCSYPIATLGGLEAICMFNNFTYSPHQHLIVAISGQTIDIWDQQKGKRVHTLSAIHGGPGPDDKIVALACHPTRPVLVTASKHGYFHVWD